MEDLMNLNLNQKWSKIIREFDQSGISKQKFCQLNGLSTSQYYYWKSKLKTLEEEALLLGSEELSSHSFIPIKRSQQPYFTVELSNKMKLTFSEVPSGQWVAKLLKAMEITNAQYK